MSSIQDPDSLIWIDLEMTGLDTACDYIIEIATIVTNSELEILAEGPVVAIYQGDEVLNAMDEWNRTQHRKSGLIDRVRSSSFKESEAEAITLDFLWKYVPQGKSPMCGNSICQDRRFLHRLMPRLEKYFHYRNLDVSTVKELAYRWAPAVYNGVEKDSTHLALADIRDSINELKYYREHFIRYS